MRWFPFALAFVAGMATSTTFAGAAERAYRITVDRPAPVNETTIFREVEGIAMPRANAFCEQQGRKLKPIALLRHNREGTSWVFDFRCLLPGDPELMRDQLAPTMRQLQEQQRGR